MQCKMRGWQLWAGLASLTLAWATPVQAGHSVLLALGDSITFGVGADDSASDISNGDRGYVGRYADYLLNSTGTRPSVINLAISGETSSSFLGQGFGLDGSGAPLRNTNYLLGNQNLSQLQLLNQTISQQAAGGNSIDHVTLTLGANDLYAALAAGIDFGTALKSFVANEEIILSDIRTKIPTTNLILLNYYDPYAPFLNTPTSPLYPYALASSQAIPVLDSLIEQEAAKYQASYVDVYSQFPATTILNETYITQGGNSHPTNAGYDRIAAAVEAVPEPASLGLVGVGISCLAVLSRRRPWQTGAGLD